MKTRFLQFWRRSLSAQQASTPLLSRLLALAQRSTAPFHTPGHHGRSLAEPLKAAWGEKIFGSDLPELPGLDNLSAPEEVIAEAQALAAELFGSDRSFFLVNGSTVGIMAAILACCGPGDAILLPRNVHRSAIAGLILSGAQPIFLAPEICPESGLVGSVTPEAIAQALEQCPDCKAVLLVSPTYEGVCADLAAIAPLCHDHGLPLIVDEAHGPHFGFHPALPAAALSQGADITVQSTHKVLAGLTQAAMVHVRSTVQPDLGDRLAQALQLLQTSSPSYLLLASLDAARMQMATEGEALMARTVALAQQARDRLQSIPGIHLFELPQPRPGFAHQDPTRLTLDVRGLGITGFELDEQLCDRFGVIAELPGLHHLSFIVSLGNQSKDIDRLVGGVAAIAQEINPKIDQAHFPSRAVRTSSFYQLPNPLTIPVLSPRQAHFSRSEAIALDQAPGRISAETVCPYPPGIPLLLPGEVISEEAIVQLERLQAAGSTISGASDHDLRTLRVVGVDACGHISP